MYVMPHTRTGWWALWLLAPVLLYPLYWSVFLLLPESVRTTGIVVVGLGVLALASFVVAGVAIFRLKERSMVLVGGAAATLLLILFFAVGEVVGGH